MRQALCCSALAILLSSFLGCGGPPSAASMTRYALRNAPEEETAPATAPPAAPNSAADESISRGPMPVTLTPDLRTSAQAPREAPAAAPKISTSAAAVDPPPPPAPLQASRPIHNDKPAEQLSLTECQARSLANLEAIGKALAAYAAKYNRLPPPAIENSDGQRMLSWRVAILPELGYPALKAQFRAQEPWNSPHNRQLLTQIPPEYQSPERFDTKTNYLGIAGIGMALGTPAGLPLDKIKDGADNTIAIVEMDDRYAHEWTEPADFFLTQTNLATVLDHCEEMVCLYC